MPRLLRWNGTDVPEELKRLPPGDYVVESFDEHMLRLSQQEEEDILRALAQLAASRGKAAHDR